MKHDVFISYCQPDRVSALRACADLENNGYRCWIAVRDNPAGEAWGAEVVDAIAAARMLLVLISKASGKSKYMASEVQHAEGANKKLLPVLLEETPLPNSLTMGLNLRHRLSFAGKSREARAEELVKAVDAVLLRRRPDPVVVSDKEADDDSLRYAVREIFIRKTGPLHFTRACPSVRPEWESQDVTQSGDLFSIVIEHDRVPCIPCFRKLRGTDDAGTLLFQIEGEDFVFEAHTSELIYQFKDADAVVVRLSAVQKIDSAGIVNAYLTIKHLTGTIKFSFAKEIERNIAIDLLRGLVFG